MVLCCSPRLFSAWVFGLFILTGLESSMAQIGPAQRRQIGDQLNAAKKSLDPQTLPNLEESKVRFLQQVVSTESFFYRGTTLKNAEAWMRYIDAKPLVQAIENKDSAGKQSRLARKLYQRLSRNLDGLDLTAVRRLRAATSHLRTSLRFRDKNRTIQLVNRQLTTLAERIGSFRMHPSAEQTATLSAILRNLEKARQARPVVQNVRRSFSWPNVRLAVGHSLIGQLARRSISRTEPVRDCILGTRLVGNAQLNGQVTARLLPSHGAVRVELTLDAAFNSCNTGYNGPVSLRTSGNGHVQATRTLLVDDFGPRWEPVHASASLSTRILKINHRFRFVRRIAAKRAAQQKYQAEQIARGRLQNQIHNQFQAETDRLLAEPLNLPLSGTRKTFQRLDISLPKRDWSSTGQYVFIDLKQAEAFQALAPSQAPYLLDAYTAALQVHETAIGNIAAQTLAGRTLNQKDLSRMLSQIRPLMPGVAQQEEKKSDESFEIVFSKFRPLIAEARDQKIRLGLRGTRFKQGSREIKRPMEITVQYQPVISESGRWYLERTGEIQVRFSGRKKLSLSQLAIQTRIQQVFEDLFPMELMNRSLSLPFPNFPSTQLQVASIQADNGWLSVGLR